MRGLCLALLKPFLTTLWEVAPGGGSDTPEPDAEAEGVLFVVAGQIDLVIDGQAHVLGEGGYAFLAPGAAWAVTNTTSANATFHWVRKAYEVAQGVDVPGKLCGE